MIGRWPCCIYYYIPNTSIVLTRDSPLVQKNQFINGSLLKRLVDLSAYHLIPTQRKCIIAHSKKTTLFIQGR